MKKYNKEDIKKQLSEIQKSRQDLEKKVGATSINFDEQITYYNAQERLYNIELAIAELQEKN